MDKLPRLRDCLVMPVQLKVFAVDSKGLNPHLVPVALEIPDGDNDTMRKRVRTLLESKGYLIRSLGFGTDRKFVAYAYPPGIRPEEPAPLHGWVYKAPQGAQTL